MLTARPTTCPQIDDPDPDPVQPLFQEQYHYPKEHEGVI